MGAGPASALAKPTPPPGPHAAVAVAVHCYRVAAAVTIARRRRRRRRRSSTTRGHARTQHSANCWESVNRTNCAERTRFGKWLVCVLICVAHYVSRNLYVSTTQRPRPATFRAASWRVLWRAAGPARCWSCQRSSRPSPRSLPTTRRTMRAAGACSTSTHRSLPSRVSGLQSTSSGSVATRIRPSSTSRALGRGRH